MPRALRSSSFTPISNSRSRICRLSDGWAVQSPLGGIREAALLSDCNEITQMTKFHCLESHAFKAYLYHTKYLLTNVNREHPMDCRQERQFVSIRSRRSLCPCKANPVLFLFTAYGPTAHASAN